MLNCEGQRRTAWTRTSPEPGLRAGPDQVGLLSLMLKAQAPARSMISSIVQVQFIILVMVLLGSLISVEGILTEDQEELLVELHNRYRGVVQPSASAMVPLKWDGNLKLVAEGYAAKCIWNHNPELEDTGENLFTGTGALDLERALEKWFLEKVDYNYDNNSCDEDKMCGHYTQMVWADTHKLGCAVHVCAQMEGLDWDEPTNFLVCNYFPAGNYEGVRPYVEGEWCSRCPENFQRCENNLCAPEVEPTDAEQIDEPTVAELPQVSVTLSATIMDTTSAIDEVQITVQEQDPTQNPDPVLKETVEQEAVVPPPATESFPPEPLSTAVLGPEKTETVPETVTETAPEIEFKTEPGTVPEPEVLLQPKPPKEDPTGDPAGSAVVYTEMEQKMPPLTGKAPPSHHLTPPSHPQTPPPENRGQKQKDVVEKRKRAETMRSNGVVLSGSWSLVFLWICLLCL